MVNNNSKIIKICRTIQFSQEANIEAEDLFDGASRGIGSYFKGKKPGTGLSFEEIDLLLPSIINRKSSHEDFMKAVDLYYTDIDTKVPKEGLPLEIGLRDNNEPLSATNMPLNIENYVAYRHAISHPFTAKNQEESYGNRLKTFYILDDKKTAEIEKQTNDIRDDAMIKYIAVKDKKDKVDQILTNLGIDTRDLDETKRIIALKTYINNDDISYAKKFMRVEKDPKLEAKYRIEKLIQTNILKRVNSVILITEDSFRIGRDMEEAVVWWEDESNSDKVGVLKARFQEFRKRSKVAKIETNEEED